MTPSSHKLAMFNVRARYLADSRFMAWLNGPGNKQPDLQRFLAGDWTAQGDLHREDVDAFALNLRPLIQDQDGYSIRCLSVIYDEFSDDYQVAKDAFKHVRTELQEFFVRQTILRLAPDRCMTNWELLETYLYGGIAHNKPGHFENFIRLTQSGAFGLFTLAPFWNLMHFVNGSVQKFAILNAEVIQWEEEPSIPSGQSSE